METINIKYGDIVKQKRAACGVWHRAKSKGHGVKEWRKVQNEDTGYELRGAGQARKMGR